MRISCFSFVFDAIAVCYCYCVIVISVLLFSPSAFTGADRLLRVKQLKSERLQFLLA